MLSSQVMASYGPKKLSFLFAQHGRGMAAAEDQSYAGPEEAKRTARPSSAFIPGRNP